MSEQKYRLVTRSDFDGLVCAILLNEIGLIDDIKFVHPKDMQDGKVVISERDITTNLPYVPGAHLVFDHHASETVRNAGERPKNYIIYPGAPSAARVVYECYGGKTRFPDSFDDMMIAVDKADAAEFTIDDILNPRGWVLLNYLMDSRTGLGRFREFRISNYQLMLELINSVRNLTIDEVLALPDMVERIDLYRDHTERAQAQIRRCTTVHGNLAVLDLRNEETIWAVNRFMIYALFPQANISIHVMWGVRRQNTVLATGKSITNRTSKTHIGELMLQYKGGGHDNAGTCQVDNEQADAVLQELIGRINADG